MADALPQTMRAAYVERLGPPDEIQVGALATPVPGPTDVLVAVELVAANPVDTFVRSGRYPTTVPFPFVMSRDLVGTAAGAGPGTGFEPGERVWANSLGHGRREGSFSEYVVVPAERCYRLPSGVDPERAVAVAHSAAPAYPGWFVHGGLRPGEAAYVGGGAGNVGSAAIAMARRAGARVLASARPADHERCREAGADVVVDYRAPDLWCRLREAAPEGVDLFWETSGHHDFDLARRVLAPGSRILVSAASEDPRPLPVRELYTSNESLRGFVISRTTVPQLAHADRLVNDMLLAGELVGQISEILPLSATPAVHGRLEAGTVTGRLLLRP